MNEVMVDYKQWGKLFESELFEKAMGDYDYDSMTWKPLTDQMYLFDCEIFDVENMYRLFLLGIQSIVPDVVISDVVEDLSAMTVELRDNGDGKPPTDGQRSVSFKCNGHDYSITLDSYGDWFNNQMFFFIDEVLKKENCKNELCVIDCQFDQNIALVYDSVENAKKLIEQNS